MNTRNTLHTNLKYYRMQKGLSQTKVADIIGVSRQAISNWEAQRSYPDLDNIVRLSDLYDITIDQLLGKEKSHDCISVSEHPKETLIFGIPSHTMLEMLCLAVILVLACSFPVIGMFVPVLLAIYMKKTERNYKLIYILCGICFFIGMYNTYISIDIFLNYQRRM